MNDQPAWWRAGVIWITKSVRHSLCFSSRVWLVRLGVSAVTSSVIREILEMNSKQNVKEKLGDMVQIAVNLSVVDTKLNLKSQLPRDLTCNRISLQAGPPVRVWVYFLIKLIKLNNMRLPGNKNMFYCSVVLLLCCFGTENLCRR